MKKTHNVNLPADLVEACTHLPVTRSGALNQAMFNAWRDPELLVKALRFRLDRPEELERIKVTYSRDSKLDPVLEKMSEMTKLPKEQVVRLCLEAYIHRL